MFCIYSVLFTHYLNMQIQAGKKINRYTRLYEDTTYANHKYLRQYQTNADALGEPTW